MPVWAIRDERQLGRQEARWSGAGVTDRGRGNIEFSNEHGEVVDEEYLEGEYEFSDEGTEEILRSSLSHNRLTEASRISKASLIQLSRLHQEWMAQNLRATKYQNGDPIPRVSDGEQWSDTLQRRLDDLSEQSVERRTLWHVVQLVHCERPAKCMPSRLARPN